MTKLVKTADILSLANWVDRDKLAGLLLTPPDQMKVDPETGRASIAKWVHDSSLGGDCSTIWTAEANRDKQTEADMYDNKDYVAAILYYGPMGNLKKSDGMMQIERTGEDPAPAPYRKGTKSG